jgi:hypothetical protein
MKKYCFIQYRQEMKLPDGIYNGRYNKQPSIIRIKDSIPVWVTFIGFMKHYEGKDKVVSGMSIFKPEGITHSNVELLLPAQELEVRLINANQFS